ncbi:cyclic nucleotide-binding domain-containing protein [Candidatus Magnetominusculus dajiuhuensis]|uniref:cyclic nucleotide-binding domain-containing protein n=1 Tax=Candidatus Magnetominusculus dajiuhuensis TaxID=3137712 RepID=UPI0019FA23D0|nr:cyclic nucleotide-binding domain-containing protein [Nitrospirota bacterium]
MVIKEFIKELKQSHPMFQSISERALMESLQVFRTFELREGESASIGGFSGDLLFVVIGKVEVTGVNGDKKELDPGDTSSKPMLFPEHPQLLTITAIEDSWLCHLDVDAFSYLSGLEETLDDIKAGGRYDAALLDKMRASTAFRRLPIEYIEDAVKGISEVAVRAGDEVISDGKEIKAFYVIAAGRAEVLRLNPESGDIEKTEELGPGDEIGEEAIIMAAKSPCTVRMLEDGVLFAMDVAKFREILQKPLLAEVVPEVARAMYSGGHMFVDVRFVEEYEESHIVGCVNVPLFDLMKRRAEFDDSKQYVVYCRSGRRSAVAAFKLKQLNIDAVSLKGGIKAWTYNDLLEPVS